jgi:hypothetical protein
MYWPIFFINNNGFLDSVHELFSLFTSHQKRNGILTFFYANALSRAYFFHALTFLTFLPETFLTSTKNAADWLIALI